ncbi:transcriptional repressor LexA [candidate division KSB1 bacterium]|nr:transcriptional repressor LexA [candidate division KSB1 bacterium]
MAGLERLTARQQKVYDLFVDYAQVHGFPPTVRELADEVGLSSTAGVHKILKILQAKGYLTQLSRGKSRSLGLAQDRLTAGARAKALPLVGEVRAGEPVLAVEEKEGDFFIDSDWVGNKNTYLLRVQGHSMVDAGIYPGDLLVVEPGVNIRNGEIIIALLEDEATVKRIYREKERIRLQPENQTMQPIYVNRDDPTLRIIGKVRGLLRKF